jgi:hypothetical protein
MMSVWDHTIIEGFSWQSRTNQRKRISLQLRLSWRRQSLLSTNTWRAKPSRSLGLAIPRPRFLPLILASLDVIGILIGALQYHPDQFTIRGARRPLASTGR